MAFWSSVLNPAKPRAADASAVAAFALRLCPGGEVTAAVTGEVVTTEASEEGWDFHSSFQSLDSVVADCLAS